MVRSHTVALLVAAAGLLGAAACATLSMYQAIRLELMTMAAYRKVANWAAAGGFIACMVVQAVTIIILVARNPHWSRILQHVLIGSAGLTLVLGGYWLVAIWVSKDIFMWECRTDLGGDDPASIEDTCSSLWPVAAGLTTLLAVLTFSTFPLQFYLIRVKILPRFTMARQVEGHGVPDRSGSGNSGGSHHYSLVDGYDFVPHMSELHSLPAVLIDRPFEASESDASTSKRTSAVYGSGHGHGHYASADNWAWSDSEGYSSSDVEGLVVRKEPSSSARSRDSRRTESTYTTGTSDMGHSSISDHRVYRGSGNRESQELMLPGSSSGADESSYPTYSYTPSGVGLGYESYANAEPSAVASTSESSPPRKPVLAPIHASQPTQWRVTNAVNGDLPTPSDATSSATSGNSARLSPSTIPTPTDQPSPRTLIREATEDALDDHFARYYRPLSTIASEREDTMSVRTRTTIGNARWDDERAGSVSRSASHSASASLKSPARSLSAGEHVAGSPATSTGPGMTTGAKTASPSPITPATPMTPWTTSPAPTLSEQEEPVEGQDRRSVAWSGSGTFGQASVPPSARSDSASFPPISPLLATAVDVDLAEPGVKARSYEVPKRKFEEVPVQVKAETA